MVLIICILVFLWACDISAQEHDNAVRRDRDYKTAERRHKEILRALKKRKPGKKITRTLARDGHGRFIAQEVIEDDPDDGITFDDD